MLLLLGWPLPHITPPLFFSVLLKILSVDVVRSQLTPLTNNS